MSIRRDKFINTLKSMFEVDKADLDFGVYKIINQKREQINDFLDNKLSKDIENQLNDLCNNEEEKINTEEKVYSHLTNFFSRYYDEGDFISKRRYKDGVYAIPYEGEEVKLYWANHDQYYIKSAENFKDYSFKLGQSKKVNFKLVEADTELNNNKALDENKLFVLKESDEFIDIENNELTIKFEYVGFPKATKQDKLNKETLDKIIKFIESKISEEEYREFYRALIALDPTEKNKKRTVLEKELTIYTSKNSFDYFIHKDLGGFLRRELDFYIKNEVLFIDDIGTENEKYLMDYVNQVKIIKSIANKIIKFLEQIENFQKRLWLKKKFVVESNYCITLDRIPRKFYPQIVSNEEQIKEWVELFDIDGSNVDEEFLESNPYLLLDTKFFDDDFKEKLISRFDNIDEETNGLIIQGDNYQTLNLITKRYSESIRCIHIDPPYNTNTSGFLYKNSFRHSSWMTMMDNRLVHSKSLLEEQGCLQIHIDENEYENLYKIANDYGLLNQGTIIWDKRNPVSGASTIATQHEYIICFSKGKTKLLSKKANGQSILRKAKELINKEGGVTSKVKEEFKKWVKSQGSFSGGEKAYCELDDNGRVYQSVHIGAPEQRKDPKFFIPLVHPITNKACPVPKSGWTGTPEFMNNLVENNEIVFGIDDSVQPRRKYFLENNLVGELSTVMYSGDKGKKYTDALGIEFPYCHPVSVYKDLIWSSAHNGEGIILDFFAGSGTTGHATIELNREDNGNRKYILAEMGEYFNIVTKPRIQKVIYSSQWKNGKPVDRDGISHMFKYMNLEQYEDTLNNIVFNENKGIKNLDERLQEEYTLSYMLDMESKDSNALLNISKLTNPFEYKLNIERNNETNYRNVDLVETFNYLLGLHVEQISAKESYNYDGENIEKYNGGQYIFKRLEGKLRDNKKVLIVWRNLTDDIKTDNNVLNKYLNKKDITLDEYDYVYINGDNTIAINNYSNDKIKLIDEEFKILMFESDTI